MDTCINSNHIMHNNINEKINLYLGSHHVHCKTVTVRQVLYPAA